MKSAKEIKQWLLENCLDEDGNLDSSDLDFSDFDGDVIFSGMKVKGDLYQSCQKVKGDLYQDRQKVKGCLHQCDQVVERRLYQDRVKHNTEATLLTTDKEKDLVKQIVELTDKIAYLQKELEHMEIERDRYKSYCDKQRFLLGIIGRLTEGN